jgi:hypothetical protein
MQVFVELQKLPPASKAFVLHLHHHLLLLHLRIILRLARLHPLHRPVLNEFYPLDSAFATAQLE